MSATRRKLVFSRGCRGYAEILRGLHDGPATVAQLVVRHNASEAVMRTITRLLWKMRLIRVAAWVKSERQGVATRIFGFGGAPDEPMPMTNNGRPSQHNTVTSGPPKPTVGTVAFQNLMKALTVARTPSELAEITGIYRTTMSILLKHMHSIGLIHIKGWERRAYHGGAPIPMYRLGVDQKDAQRPAPDTRDERNARYNAGRKDRRHTVTVVRALCFQANVFNQAA